LVVAASAWFRMLLRTVVPDFFRLLLHNGVPHTDLRRLLCLKIITKIKETRIAVLCYTTH
jgi:hypothetical protein